MAPLSLFGENAFKRRPPQYRDATLADFGGGLNVRDNQRTMPSRYAPVLTNFNPQRDRSMKLRWGSLYRADVTGVVAGTRIRELIEFNGSRLAVMSSGEIARIDDTGAVTAIWNTAIAAALPGAPTAWSSVSAGDVDYTEFNGSLIIVNGDDKPLIVDSSFAVEYLNDPATGSNVNTPIGRYVTTVGNYLVMAGITGAEGDIYVSSAGTSGVWPGDPLPNDSVVVPIGTYVAERSGEITAIASFHNSLIVGFGSSIVVVILGEYDSTTHVPRVQDHIIDHGMLGHRTVITTKNDLIMASDLGWHTATRTSFGLIETKLLSDIVDPSWVGSFMSETTLGRFVFSVHDRLENRIITQQGGVGYSLLSSDKELFKKPVWSNYTWLLENPTQRDFDCGCTDATGRVWFAQRTKIYQMGNSFYENEAYTSDWAGEYTNAWAPATAYAVGDIVGAQLDSDLGGSGIYLTALQAKRAHISSVDFDDDYAADLWEFVPGAEIEFDWEFPWLSVNSRARSKFIKEAMIEAQGTAEFRLSIFVDGMYKEVLPQDLTVPPFPRAYTPALYMDFVGGGSGGYGVGEQAYGGGRRTDEERGWGLPVKFKIMKMRIHGSTTKGLHFLSLTILYLIGSFGR